MNGAWRWVAAQRWIGRGNEVRRERVGRIGIFGMSVIVVPVWAIRASHHDAPAGEIGFGQTVQQCFTLRTTVFDHAVSRVTRRGRRCRLGGTRGQQFAAGGDVSLRVIVAQAAQATRLRVAFWEDVQTPAADEFDSRKFHGCGVVAAACRLACARGKRHRAVVVTDEAAVGNRAARHVPRQIFQHVCGVTVF